MFFYPIFRGEDKILSSQVEKITVALTMQEGKVIIIPANQITKEQDLREISQFLFQPVAINSASKEKLMTVHGIGTKLSAAIIEYRQQHQFSSPEDLGNVAGISRKRAKNWAANSLLHFMVKTNNMSEHIYNIDIPILVLVGATAVGKTELSLKLAECFDCEIISMDSMQVYRYMDIGTAKITQAEKNRISHHLIDIVNPDEDYDAAAFSRDASLAISDIGRRGKYPLITGGTGLYLQSLLHGIFKDSPTDKKVRDNLQQRLQHEGARILYNELMDCDPKTAKRIHINDSQRLIRALEIFQVSGVSWSELLEKQKQQNQKNGSCNFNNILQFGLTTERELLYNRINTRTELMLKNGFQQEVEALRQMGYSPNLKSMQSIGYRHVNSYLDKKCDYNEMKRLLARDTRRYAKRQYTWFNRNPDLLWFDKKEEDKIYKKTERWIKNIK